MSLLSSNLSEEEKKAMKISVLIDEWWEYQNSMKCLSVATRKIYAHHLRRFKEAHEELTVGGLTDSLVRRYIAKETSRSKHVGYGAKAALTSLCKFAKAEGIIYTLPTDAVERIKPVSDRARPATSDEVRALFAACERLRGSQARKDQAKAFLALLTYGGLRISESLDIEVRDIELGSGLLVVRNGKGGKRREIFMNEEAKPYLDTYLREKGDSDKVIALGLSGGEHLFNRLRILAKCRQVTPHKLRHAIATRMLDAGAKLNVVQEFLGHENIATTGIYLHTNEEKMKDAAKFGALNTAPPAEPLVEKPRFPAALPRRKRQAIRHSRR